MFVIYDKYFDIEYNYEMREPYWMKWLKGPVKIHTDLG